MLFTCSVFYTSVLCSMCCTPSGVCLLSKSWVSRLTNRRHQLEFRSMHGIFRNVWKYRFLHSTEENLVLSHRCYNVGIQGLGRWFCRYSAAQQAWKPQPESSNPLWDSWVCGTYPQPQHQGAELVGSLACQADSLAETVSVGFTETHYSKKYVESDWGNLLMSTLGFHECPMSVCGWVCIKK